MSALPEGKVPYIDSHGERYRNKQIIVQLPPYDSEARFCNDLSDEERRELRIFVALRKRDALDRGVVKQIPDVSEGYSCKEVNKYLNGTCDNGNNNKFGKRCFCVLCQRKQKEKEEPALNQRKPRKTVNTLNRNTAICGMRELINQHDSFFLSVWWPSWGWVYGSVCTKSWSEYKLARCLLCLLCLQGTFGGLDLLLQRWKDILWEAPCRNAETPMCCM